MLHQIQQENLANENRTSVSLSSSGISTSDIRQIISIISQRTNPLDSLDLTANNIHNKGAKLLATLTNVRYLNLGVNDIDDDGIESLVANPTIESLDLSSNSLTDKATSIILQSATQTWFNIDRNGISSENVKKIRQKISANRELKKTIEEKSEESKQEAEETSDNQFKFK